MVNVYYTLCCDVAFLRGLKFRFNLYISHSFTRMGDLCSWISAGWIQDDSFLNLNELNDWHE